MKKQGDIDLLEREEKIDKNHQEKSLILMVDDSPKNLQIMASILTNAGYRITIAKSAAGHCRYWITLHRTLFYWM